MKKFCVLFVILFTCVSAFAQSGNGKISYQAVVRNSSNQLVYDVDLTVAVSVANSETGAAAYREAHAVHSNANGLISLLIGDGVYVSGNWEDIQWNVAWVTATIAQNGVTLAEHHLPLSAVPYALYADRVNPAALAGYLTADSAVIVNLNTKVTNLQGDVTQLQEATRKDALCDSVETCVKGWISDSATVCITMALADPASEVNHVVDTIARNNIHDTAEVLRSQMPVVNDGALTLQKNGADVGTFTANQSGNQTINITVPTCDSLENCLLIQEILARLDRLERQNDSLAREIDKMKPALTVTGPEEATVCLGSSKPVTYTATFHNCSSNDYTLAWKVNGTDSSAVTVSELTVNVTDAGEYEVVCIATRSDGSFVTDTVATTVGVDSNIPSFTATVTNLTVELADVTNTATIQWDTDSAVVGFSGTTAIHTYPVAGTVTVTATNEGGCTFAQELVLRAVAPMVTTDSIPAGAITATTAKAYGTVTSDGGIPETKRGMVYAISDQNLELGADGVDSVMNGTGMGNFSCDLKHLVPCTQYYVRAFAMNDVDTVYGEVKPFSTSSFTCGSTLTDIDGNTYATLQLGSQCWMKENLRATRFADGTEITKGGNSSSSVTHPFYYEPTSNIATYGRLYNWAAAMHGSVSSSANPSGVQGVCPDGWHLPSDAEWTQLTSFVASNSENVCGNNPAYIAKALVSEEGWGDWGTTTGACVLFSNPNDNNKTGFSVLPAGTWEVGGSGGYYTNNGHSIFRTATELGEYQAAFAREFYGEYAYVGRTAPIKEVGYSVRCVLDCASETAYLPTVSAVTFTSMVGTAISMAASVIADGGAEVTERGVCWGTSSQPTAGSAHTSDSGTGIGDFTVSGSLTPGETYYVRAYATNSEGTAYGAEVTFMMPNLPTVTTAEVSNVTANTATSGGNVTAGGDMNVTARGVCWSASPNPTVGDSHTTDGSGTGSFTSHITGLSATTTYYVRAYATNSAGTTYGDQVSFTTTEALPVVTTSAVSEINATTTSITATCGGNVTDMGAYDVTARGVCWSTSQNPTVSDNHTTDGSGTGSFTGNITGLAASTTYYVRAYATNSAGTAYGNQVSFTVPLVDGKSCPEAPTVTDHEGNVYATVKIGDQCWMRENLRTTTSPKTGTYLVKPQKGSTLNVYSSFGSKVAHWYMFDSTAYAGYGLYYNWCAAMDTANPANYVEVPTPSNTSGNNTAFNFPVSGNHRGICPVGWHLPSFQEFNTLKSSPNNTVNALAGSEWSSAYSNSSGFTALPAGYFGSYNFQNNDNAHFWSCTNGDRAQCLYLTTSQVRTALFDKNYGMSVRCLRD